MTILINLLRLSCFLVWGLFFATQAVNGQNVSAQIGNYTSTSCQPGDTISIPVTIISAPGIGVSAISLAIEYDTTKLECLNHITGLNPVLSGPFIGNCGNFTNLGTSYNLTGKQFRVSWYQLNPVQLGGLAFNLSFRVLTPGSSSVQWDLQTPEVCGFYDELAEEISQVSYQNGSIQCNNNPYNLQTDLTHVGDCFYSVGDTLDVPVTLQNFNGLGITSISMAIDYDSTKLRCLPGIIALNPSLTSGFLSNSGWFNNLGPNANASGSQFRAAWYQLNPVTLSGALFKIRFITKVPGIHNIVFDNQTPGNCEYSDSNALVVPNTHWTNGSVTASLLPRSLFATDTLFLCGDSTTIGVTPGLGQYLWNTGDTTALCIINRSGWYSCTVFSGQCTLSDSVYVDLLSMRLVASADTLCAGSVLRLSASLTGPTLSGLFDGHRVYQASNPVPVGNQPRTYSIRFKTNQNLRQSFLSHGSLATGPGLVDLGMNLNVGYGAASGHCASINSGPSFFSTAHANTWGQAILMNEWNTLTYVMGSGGSMAFSDTRVFLNGNLISHGSGAVPSCGHNWGGWNYQTEPSPLFIGSGLGANPPFGGSALFDGDFDYISIWNRALSDQEVLNAQNTNPWGITNGLQHLYTFSGFGDQSELIDEVSQNNAYLVRGSAANPLSTVRYQWSTGDTTASIRVNPTQTTTYTLSVNDSYRTCTDSFTVYVTPNTLPTSLFPQDSLFVCGDSVNLSIGTGYDSYLWNAGDTLSNLTAKRSGWFTCIATLGNCQVTDSLYVSLISDRIVQPTMPVCAGTTVTLQTIGNYSNSLRQGMIAHWSFNGQAGSTYGINRPNDYEQIGYATDRFGLAGRAASFNGSNQYIQTNQPVLTGYGPYSISFWAQSNSGSDMEIFSQACPSDCQVNGQFFHDFRVQLNAGQCQALGLSFKNESHFATANTITNDGLWHHYTMVVGSNSNHSYSNIEFYKDGQFMFVNCGHNWGGWQYMLPQVPTRIGAPVKGGTVPFQGKLDEITVWNRALNRSEITDMQHEQPTRYLWSTGDTTPNITVNPLQTTTYYVTISNGIHSCVDSVTVQVVPNSIPPNFLGNDSLFVCGNSILLNAGSGYSAYQWSNGQTTDTLRVRNSGWYKCIVTNGVCSSTDSVFVSLINADAQANDNLICQGNSTTLNVRGFPGALVNSNSHFSVRLSVNMSQYTGPIASNGMRIGGNLGALGGVIDGIPMSIWNPTSSECALDSLGNSLWSTEIEFPVSALGSTVLFKFVNGNWGNNEGTANNALVDYGCGLNDGSGNINRSITLERGLDLIYCYDSCTNCDGGAPNQSQMRTIWSTGDTTASITVNPTHSTTYYVTISNGIHSCTDSVTVNVLPNPLNPNLFPSDTLLHCGDSLVLDAGAGFDRYEWSTSDTTHTNTVRGTGWYRCRVFDGLCSVEDSVFVSLNSYRIAQDDTAICMGTAIVLGTVSSELSSTTNLIIPEGSVYQADSVTTILSNQAVTGSRTIEVVQSTDFKIGDLLCITTSQVNSISDSNLAGVYELRRVFGINGQIFTIDAPLEYSYPLPQNAVTQVIRVPEFNEVWVEGTLTCKEWDGTTGGILIVRANKITVSNNGRITADAKGFRGGQEVSGWGGGYQGEGPYGVGGRNYEPNGSGGGGGNAEWCASGQGGGGGGYSNVGGNGIIHCHGCGGGWWFSSGCGTSGFGGQALSNHTGRMLIGSGGGSGGIDGDNPDGGGWGGRGGGVVCLLSAEINSTSNGITSQGGNGHSAPGETGGGGGGSGGAVWHTGGLSVVPQWISVSGGVGGQGYYGGNWNGGNGSEGVRVQLNTSAFSSLSENVLWSTGDTTASINVTPTQTTTYYVTISNGIHSCVDSVTVRVSPKIFIPNMEVCQGETINVPVIATRLDSVAAISLALNYNDQAMTYVGNTGLRSDMVSTTSIGTAPGQVRMAWFGLTPLISNSADTLVYYQFVVHQPGSFGWNIQVQGDCELADLNLNILDYCFEGGSLSLVDTVTILSSSQGPYIVEVGDSIHLNVQSSGALNQRWQIWNGNLGQWDNLQDNGAYQGTSTPSLTYHCLTYQRPFPKFRLELSNGCRFWYGPEMPISIKQRISVSLGSAVGCEGDTLEIPVIISGAREVGAVSLVFAFNANSLQLVDWINSAPQTASNQWFVNQVGNEIRLAWFSLQPANIPDGQPLGVLKVVGLGSSGLTWDLVTAGNCEFGDEEASSIPASFVSGSLTIHPLPSVQLTASAQAICPNGGVSVLSTVADPTYTYQWYLNGQPLTGSTGDSHLAGQSGLYQVKVTNTNGCTRWSTIQTISDHPLPNPVVQAVGNTMTCEQPVLLNASATQGNSLEFWWYLNGIPLSSTPSTQWTATQSGDYSVKALDLGILCENWSPTVAININPIPTSTISYTGLTTFCLGDSLTLLANTNLGTAFQWTTNGQPIPDATNPTFVARQQGTYAVVVSTALGCTSTSGSINVWVQNCNAINGRLSYNNTLRTPLRNTKILFQDSAGSILDSTTTNNVGDYSFSGYSNGFYRVKAAPNLTWGGVNATDALAIVRHYTNYVLMQGFRLQAADVNGSNNVNNTDALLITRRYSNLVPTFNVGAWLSENPIVQANGQTITQNIQTLCYGDVNGSYNPVQTRLAPKISFVELGTLSAPNKRFHLPIYSLDNQELGAISLAMVLPKGTRVLKVHSKIPEGIMEYGQWEDELRIGWFTQNQFAVKEGELLFEIELCMDGDTKEFGPSDIEVRGLSELANFWAIPYDMARLGVPSVKIWNKSSEDLIIWPNPTNENARLRLKTSEPVLSCSLRVLDAVGREVYQANPSIVKIGDVQELVLPSAEWAKGIYAVQTNWTTLNGLNKSKTVMLRRE